MADLKTKIGVSRRRKRGAGEIDHLAGTIDPQNASLRHAPGEFHGQFPIPAADIENPLAAAEMKL